jgi:hypothetical protein
MMSFLSLADNGTAKAMLVVVLLSRRWPWRDIAAESC